MAYQSRPKLARAGSSKTLEALHLLHREVDRAPRDRVLLYGSGVRLDLSPSGSSLDNSVILCPRGTNPARSKRRSSWPPRPNEKNQPPR
jgi:hypothetical protein